MTCLNSEWAPDELDKFVTRIVLSFNSVSDNGIVRNQLSHETSQDTADQVALGRLVASNVLARWVNGTMQ